MTHLSTSQVDVIGDNETLWRIRDLPPHLQRQVVERAVLWGVDRGIRDWRAAGGAGMGSLGADALSQAVSIAVERALKPLMPVLGEKLIEVAAPAAKKAAEAAAPAMKKVLDEKLPTFAIATGIIAGVLVLTGMGLLGGYVVKKVRRAS